MKNNSIYIDTTKKDNCIVKLFKKSNGSLHVFKKNCSKSEEIIPALQTLLKEQNSSMDDISHLYIEKGPGSYTGLRVGISIVNTLAWLLDININNSKNKNISPKYI
jgi:tRNA threonylcarbamoyladenosine biosynthesis protein TsaB